MPKIDALLDEANRRYHLATTLRETAPDLARYEENLSRLALVRLSLAVQNEATRELLTRRSGGAAR